MQTIKSDPITFAETILGKMFAPHLSLKVLTLKKKKILKKSITHFTGLPHNIRFIVVFFQKKRASDLRPLFAIDLKVAFYHTININNAISFQTNVMSKC